MVAQGKEEAGQRRERKQSQSNERSVSLWEKHKQEKRVCKKAKTVGIGRQATPMAIFKRAVQTKKQ